MPGYSIPRLEARWSLGDGREVELCRVEGRLRYAVKGLDRHYAGLLWQDEVVLGAEGPLVGMPADLAARLAASVEAGPPTPAPPPAGIALTHRGEEVHISLPGSLSLVLGVDRITLVGTQGRERSVPLDGVLGSHSTRDAVWVLPWGKPWKLRGLLPNQAEWIRLAVDHAVLSRRAHPTPEPADRSVAPVPRGFTVTRDLGSMEVDLGPDRRHQLSWLVGSASLATAMAIAIASMAILGSTLALPAMAVAFFLTGIPALHGLILRQNLLLEGRRLVLWRQGMWREGARTVFLEDVRRVQNVRERRQVEIEVEGETLILAPRRDQATREWLVAQLEEAVGERLAAVERQALTAVDGPPQALEELVRRP